MPACKVTTCINTTTRNICDSCWRKFTGSVEWLYRHVTDLEYRMNKAYGHSEGEKVSGGSGPTSSPIRENIHQLLYETDEYGNDSLQLTLRMFLRCLGVTYRQTDSLKQLLRLLLRQPAGIVRGNPATPVYAPQFNLIASKARRLLATPNETKTPYGECPTPGCDHQLSCLPGDDECTCKYCGKTYPTGLLRARQHWRLSNSREEGTQTELLGMLKAQGITIKEGTLRKWVAEGDIHPTGQHAGRKTYRLGDVYARATRNLIPTDKEWTQNETSEGKNTRTTDTGKQPPEKGKPTAQKHERLAPIPTQTV